MWVAIIGGFTVNLFACGQFFPNNMLDEGDAAVLQPPIADFQGDLQRMKLTTSVQAVPLASVQSFSDQSAELEIKDLASALKQEKVPDGLATAVLQSHLAERMKLSEYLAAFHKWSSYREWVYETNGTAHLIGSTNPPPAFPAVAVTPGLPREFADYFAGAIAWHQHEEWKACECWERVLALPEAERQYKSTWAAFMLARYYGSQTNSPADVEAMKYYGQVRSLVKRGFADAAGLAVASIGGEARIWLRRKDYERAISLYLEQFAAGDVTALNSLRFSVAMALGENGATTNQLQALADNPTTRRVITAYLISRHPYDSRSEAAGIPEAKSFFDRTDKWLAAVEAAHVRTVEFAEQFALAAYQADDMDAAQRWVSRADGSPVALWLQAKLDLRAGKIDSAAKLLAKVSRKFPQELSGTNPPASFAQELYVDVNLEYGERVSAGQQALAELGVLHLARREYVQSLDALLRSGYWMDAAYVAERVLTTEELKKYVDRNWPPVSRAQTIKETKSWPDGDEMMTNAREQIRYLLARRLARESTGKEAQAYFPAEYSDAYGSYLADLRAGRDQNLKADVRAKELFAAAVMMRTNGMELFGTETDPDWNIYGGEYVFGLTWQDRTNVASNAKINFAATNEIMRAAAQPVEPYERFHYRWQAAALAWEAAQLMPDDFDDTARVLCTGGTWIKNRDAQAADKFYKALVRRCRHTPLGEQADVLRWFPAQKTDGGLPRLDTIEITPDLTNAVAKDNEGNTLYSTEFPLPGRRYCVNRDEDVYTIARAVQRLGCPVCVEDILQANPGLKRGPITVGQVIDIPNFTPPKLSEDGTYTVQVGDTLARIAKHFDVTVSALLDANQIDRGHLKVGQKLRIPQPVDQPPAFK